VNVVVERNLESKYGEDVHVYENLEPIEETVKRTAHEDLEKVIKDTDNVVKALSLIIELMQNNPIKINSLIIAKGDTLIELIKLITGAEDVELKYSDIDPDCGCCSGTGYDLESVNQILVTKEKEIYNLKYNCPEAIVLLDKYRINYKFVQK
jgi:hypothetical protein